MSNWIRRPWWLCAAMAGLLAAGVALAIAKPLVAAEAGSPRSATLSNPPTVARDAKLGSVLAALDDEHFATRRRAHAELVSMLKDTRQAVAVAAQVHSATLNPTTSVELRVQLQSLLEQNPQLAAPTPPSTVPTDEIAATIAQLDDDSATVRAAAEARLQWYADNPQLACRMLAPLRAVLANSATTREARRVAQILSVKARRAWLADETLDQFLPPVDEKQIREWIAVVGRASVETADERLRLESAQRELMDLLPREAYRARVAELVSAALETTALAGANVPEPTVRPQIPKPEEHRLPRPLGAAPDPEGIASLQEIHDWTRPAMVAECWANGLHMTIQHLLVDVPQIPEGRARATHFDRIDDRTAHCVSGNSLTPGDYPVGVAIPHPDGQDVIFHLVNVPTPRRRMMYEVALRQPDELRFTALSQRTVEAILADKRHLTELEIGMLAQLDAEVVSKFVGPYFAAVPDRALSPVASRFLEQTTERDAICFLMARAGTRAAQPALEREAASRSAGNTTGLPMARLASLSIARRDPWPEVDAWLANLVGRPREFALPKGELADLGATAAAMLVWRHGVADEWFELELIDDNIMESVGVLPYRFKQADSRAKVLAWWATQHSEHQAAAAP